MKNYKSINEVLKKGQTIVNVPVSIIMIVTPILSVFLSPLILQQEYRVFGILAGVILGFVLAWLWWSYRIVKWRIWAFENTKKSDWRELKESAIDQKLIWNDGNLFEKTEIRSRKETQKINEINAKIKQIEGRKKRRSK